MIQNNSHIKNQRGATALMEAGLGLALVLVLAAQVIPNTFEMRESALDAVVVTQVLVTRDALKADFAERSLNDPDALYADSQAQIQAYLPGGLLLEDPYAGTRTNPIYYDQITKPAFVAGSVFWFTPLTGNSTNDGFEINGLLSERTIGIGQ